MPSSLNADNGVVSGTAGLKSSADSSGVLDLQTNGTTAISISASQVVSFANQPTYTGGTANGVMFLNGSKAVTTGTALVFDGSRLLVGTTTAGVVSGGIRAVHDATEGTPTAIGDEVGWVQRNFNSAQSCAFAIVSGTASTSSLYLGDKDSINVGSVVYSNSDNSMRFNASGSEQMRLNSTGLGIGTSSPAAKLDVSGGSIRVNEDGVGTKILTIRSNWAGVDPAINVTTSNALLLMTANTERARISAAGNFGIGTTSPAFTLDVAGTGNFQGIQTSGSPSLLFGANKWMIQYESNTTRAYYCGPDASTRNNWEVYSATSTGAPLLTARFNSDRNLAINNLGLSTTPTTSGTGITFPGTQAASSDSNTLDDYEEGTFTPAFASGTFTYGTRTGFYTKVGRLVTVNFFIMWSAKSGAGTLSVNGFPFTSTSAASYRATGAVGYTSGVGFAVGTQITWAMSQNYTGADLAIVITDAATQFADVSGMSAAGEIQGTISYIV